MKFLNYFRTFIHPPEMEFIPAPATVPRANNHYREVLKITCDEPHFQQTEYPNQSDQPPAIPGSIAQGPCATNPLSVSLKMKKEGMERAADLPAKYRG